MRSTCIFERENENDFCKLLECELWISKMEYLTNMFQHLSVLNISNKDGNENLLSFTNNVKVSRKKKILMIWKRKASSGCLEMFTLIRKWLVNDLIPLIVEHLTTLKSNLNFYFPSINTKQYNVLTDDVGLSLAEAEELATIFAKEVSIDQFWISTKEEYSSIAIL